MQTEFRSLISSLSRGTAKLEAEGPELPRKGTKERRVIDAFVKLVERTYGDEIDARLRALHTTKNDAGYDPFGFDPESARSVFALITFLHRFFFRPGCFGWETAPRGRPLFAPNHSGRVPLDGVMSGAAFFLVVTPPVLARSMVEKWAQKLPFF